MMTSLNMLQETSDAPAFTIKTGISFEKKLYNKQIKQIINIVT